MKEPSRLLVKSDTVPVESAKSELKAADTWFRICAADVLYLERDQYKGHFTTHTGPVNELAVLKLPETHATLETGRYYRYTLVCYIYSQKDNSRT